MAVQAFTSAEKLVKEAWMRPAMGEVCPISMSTSFDTSRSFASTSSGKGRTFTPSGKAGASVALTDALGAYGEVSFVGSGDRNIDRGYGTKVGLKYSF